MKVDFYIYKVAKEFADDVGTRYIAQAHLFGTPEYRWFATECLVELDGGLRASKVDLGIDLWSAVECGLEAKGGAIFALDLDEQTFSELFT